MPSQLLIEAIVCKITLWKPKKKTILPSKHGFFAFKDLWAALGHLFGCIFWDCDHLLPGKQTKALLLLQMARNPSYLRPTIYLSLFGGSFLSCSSSVWRGGFFFCSPGKKCPPTWLCNPFISRTLPALKISPDFYYCIRWAYIYIYKHMYMLNIMLYKTRLQLKFQRLRPPLPHSFTHTPH